MGEHRGRKATTVAKKHQTGIDGLDGITRGGLPRGRASLVMGEPGCGKTVLGLQILFNRAFQSSEPGIFVTFEENTDDVIANIEGFSWAGAVPDPKTLFLLDGKVSPDTVSVGDFDITGLLGQLEAQAQAMGAQWIVFDSIDFLLALLNNLPSERRELHRLVDWVNRSGFTTLLTGKLNDADPDVEARYSFLQFLVDCVIELKHELTDRLSSRALRIVKYRGSSFVDGEIPFMIDAGGIEIPVYEESTEVEVSRERLSTGVSELDTVLGNGIYRGSSILVSGGPGTAKTTLMGTLIDAACRRGEKALYISFDENPAEIIRNLSSIGLELDSHIDSGHLEMHTLRTEAVSADIHLLRMQALIEKSKAALVVIDPVSALLKTGDESISRRVAERLIYRSKAKCITLAFTSLLQDPAVEQTPLEISTMADTWIHLKYAIQSGERNRALTVVKSRGTKHSNQVRELVLSNNGVDLVEVYQAEGEVLFGTLRWQKEAEEEMEQEQVRMEADRKRREIEIEREDLKSQTERLHKKLEMKERELERLNKQEKHRAEKSRRHKDALHTMRGGKSDQNQYVTQEQ